MDGTNKEISIGVGNFINNALNDFKNLTNALRPLSKPASEVNNTLINRLLLANDRDSLILTKDMLSHLLHIVDLKGISGLILSILTKVIAFVKTLQEGERKAEQKLFQSARYQQQMSTILYHIIDIIFLLKNKYKQAQMVLRVIQTTFSLIDTHLLQFANYNLLTRLYAICFQCCLSTAVIQNISISALFTITEIVFSTSNVQDSTQILCQFLEYLYSGKKFAWIKDQQLRGIVWDLIIVAIRNFPTSELQYFEKNKNIMTLIQEMYKTALQKAFTIGEENPKSKQKNSKKGSEFQKSINFKKGMFPDFLRYYKLFVYFSIHLSIRVSPLRAQLVPFRQNISAFKVMHQLQRSTKVYILLQGVSLLLTQSHKLLIEDEKGIVLLDVFSKIVEQLCLANTAVDINGESGDFYLQKMCGDFNKITDSDYAKLIKNSIIKLRKNFQAKKDQKYKNEQLLSERSELSQKSQVDVVDNKGTSQRKKWQRMIKSVIRIIRYLTSLNMKQGSNEQTIRKLIIELQYWFLICPSNKTRNLILQQLLSTSTLIDTKLQAIKVSQCVQLGSNIIYGYFDSLDSLGLTIIMKMLAGVKTSWDEGKGFEELDEVCMMSQKIYFQQRLVHDQKSFTKTIQAFVQCANSLLADMQQPHKHQQKIKKVGKNPQDKFLKMIEYIFSKLQLTLQTNRNYISNQWNFLTGFWISFCSNRNPQIKQRAMIHIGSVIPTILKQGDIQQQLILSTYLQLSKLHLPEISKQILTHLKQILLSINCESAILQIFRIVKVIMSCKNCNSFINQVYELQQMLIKQSFFRVKTTENLIFIIDSMTISSGDKNQQYKIVSLMWNISDHLKSLTLNQNLKQNDRVWRHLFNKLLSLGLHSVHGETKQACIHTFTQIVAESTTIIDLNTFFVIMKDIYLPLFFILLGMNQKSPMLEGGLQIQVMKVAIKNFIKIIKKCISSKIQRILELVQIMEKNLKEFLASKTTILTIEYLFELCALLQFLKTPIQIQKQNTVLKTLVIDIMTEMERQHDGLDKTSLIWRKKYEPVFYEIKKYYFVHES